MLFVIVGGVVAVGLWVAFVLTDGLFDRSDIIPCAFFVLLFAALGAGIGCIPATVIGAKVEGTCEANRAATLVDLFDATGPSGHFFLGTGFVNDQLTYFYFTKEGDYYVSHRETFAHIYEDADGSPTVQTFTYELPGPVILGHALPGEWFAFNTGWRCSTDFHVPPGTVMSGYRVGQG